MRVAIELWKYVLFSTVLASLKHSQLFWRMFVYFAHCTGSVASRHSPLGWIALCKIYRPGIDLQLWLYHWLSALGFHSLMVSTSCPITSYGFDCSTAHLEEERTTSLPPKLLISFIRATCWFILIRSFILASQMFFYAGYSWTELHHLLEPLIREPARIICAKASMLAVFKTACFKTDSKRQQLQVDRVLTRLLAFIRFIGSPSAWKASVAELPAFFAQGSSSVDTSQTEAIEDWVYLLHHTRGYAFISWPQRQVSVLIAEPQNIRQSNHYEGLLPAM